MMFVRCFTAWFSNGSLRGDRAGLTAGIFHTNDQSMGSRDIPGEAIQESISYLAKDTPPEDHLKALWEMPIDSRPDITSYLSADVLLRLFAAAPYLAKNRDFRLNRKFSLKYLLNA